MSVNSVLHPHQHSHSSIAHLGSPVYFLSPAVVSPVLARSRIHFSEFECSFILPDQEKDGMGIKKDVQFSS